MIVGCYDLNLYCDRCNPHWSGQPTAEYTGFDRSEAYRMARRDGWIINSRRQVCYCPNCSGKKPARILRVVLAFLAMYAAIGAPFAVHLLPGW